ncbi:hypothetical protein RF11_12097 [Thelohanellus kitauei]|uniref:Uncharacterized protein n=1 Tax=Thelohanellus kitauei TaxID=669202 RepID=A0A0C2I525_THEKT|nr:hypothetical protein RF11_12097 [Thelohanellus kitauei]
MNFVIYYHYHGYFHQFVLTCTETQCKTSTDFIYDTPALVLFSINTRKPFPNFIIWLDERGEWKAQRILLMRGRVVEHRCLVESCQMTLKTINRFSMIASKIGIS